MRESHGKIVRLLIYWRNISPFTWPLSPTGELRLVPSCRQIHGPYYRNFNSKTWKCRQFPLKMNMVHACQAKIYWNGPREEISKFFRLRGCCCSGLFRKKLDTNCKIDRPLTVTLPRRPSTLRELCRNQSKPRLRRFLHLILWKDEFQNKKKKYFFLNSKKIYRLIYSKLIFNSFVDQLHC